MDQILERIAQVTGARTQLDLARILNVRQSSISDAKRRNSLPHSWLVTLFDKYYLNPDWVRHGTGSPFLKADQEKELPEKPVSPRSMQFFQSGKDETAKASVVMARAARLVVGGLGMMSENLHRYATSNTVSYGEESFDQLIHESGCLEEDIAAFMSRPKITTTGGPEHGGHAEAQETQTPNEAPAEGSLQQD